MPISIALVQNLIWWSDALISVHCSHPLAPRSLAIVTEHATNGVAALRRILCAWDNWTVKIVPSGLFPILLLQMPQPRWHQSPRCLVTNRCRCIMSTKITSIGLSAPTMCRISRTLFMLLYFTLCSALIVALVVSNVLRNALVVIQVSQNDRFQTIEPHVGCSRYSLFTPSAKFLPHYLRWRLLIQTWCAE